MNDSLVQDLSVYQLALGVPSPPQALHLAPATVLSLVRSQIDLLIEQQIVATLWVKLPPGKIWHSEILRYQSSIGASGVIYNCQIGGEGEAREDKLISSSGSSDEQITWQLLPNSQLCREYFMIVLSPQFCSLILSYRPRKRRRKTKILKRVNSKKITPLLTINTVEGRIIQQVLDGIQQARTPESSVIVSAEFICPTAPEAALMNQLLAKQIQQQQAISQQIMTRRIGKLQQQNHKLHIQEHLKDEYLKNVCQELRTPLTHMKTALSLLNSPSLKSPQRQRYLEMLKRECDRQNSLIAGLLDLVDLEQNLAGTPLESVRLSEIVPGVVSTYQPVAQEKGIMLAYTVPAELPPVKCVSGGLKLIVINLLHNSIKFTPKGGQVWVRARLQGDYVQLEFRDTGIGIAESEISKIFDSFYRVRSGITEDSSSPGLGLTIVQQLLVRSGGSISVKSRLSEGSTFIVQLLTITQNS